MTLQVEHQKLQQHPSNSWECKDNFQLELSSTDEQTHTVSIIFFGTSIPVFLRNGSPLKLRCEGKIIVTGGNDKPIDLAHYPSADCIHSIAPIPRLRADLTPAFYVLGKKHKIEHSINDLADRIQNMLTFCWPSGVNPQTYTVRSPVYFTVSGCACVMYTTDDLSKKASSWVYYRSHRSNETNIIPFLAKGVDSFPEDFTGIAEIANHVFINRKYASTPDFAFQFGQKRIKQIEVNPTDTLSKSVIEQVLVADPTPGTNDAVRLVTQQRIVKSVVSGDLQVRILGKTDDSFFAKNIESTSMYYDNSKKFFSVVDVKDQNGIDIRLKYPIKNPYDEFITHRDDA
ncbi:MAG: hypothetical protein P0S94_05385 [Simkaniaceae bacterium]|nr:hypothetical protein [Simkaniaceae bacterium]